MENASIIFWGASISFNSLAYLGSVSARVLTLLSLTSVTAYSQAVYTPFSRANTRISNT